MEKLTSDLWLAKGTLYFAEDSTAVTLWLDGKGPLPKTGPFEFWCPLCGEPFKSELTPRNCPAGHTAEEIGDDAVLLTHETYAACTFPFFVGVEQKLKTAKE